MTNIKFKFITVAYTGAESNGRPSYNIINNRGGYSLGQIYWYPAWRQYVVMFDEQAVFSMDCLQDIVSALPQLSTFKETTKLWP